MIKLKERTIDAAIRATQMKIPKFILRDSEKHSSDKAAAENIRILLRDLVECHDNKLRVAPSIIYALRELQYVAEHLETAAELKRDQPNEVESLKYSRAKKQACDALLEAFGLHTPQGAPSSDRQYIIREMGHLLCPPLDDDLEPIGEPKCASINQAAQVVAKKISVNAKTAIRTWNDFEKSFE